MAHHFRQSFDVIFREILVVAISEDPHFPYDVHQLLTFSLRENEPYEVSIDLRSVIGLLKPKEF